MGYSICIAFICLSAASCCAYAIAVTAANRKRDKMPVDVGLTEYEKTELGVSYPAGHFNYIHADMRTGHEPRLPVLIIILPEGREL